MWDTELQMQGSEPQKKQQKELLLDERESARPEEEDRLEDCEEVGFSWDL